MTPYSTALLAAFPVQPYGVRKRQYWQSAARQWRNPPWCKAFQPPCAARAAKKTGFTGETLQSCGVSLVKENKMKASIISAIRSDKLVGVGSCSVIDECWTDAEIAAALVDHGITTARKAVAWARALNKAFWERADEMSGW